MDRINMLPVNDVYGALVLGMDTSNVRDVFVAGRPMKRDGRLVGVDLARIQRLAVDSRDHLAAQSEWPTLSQRLATQR
jgi:cytosine/adenosine deaminase-related metal-dependent hydrolase